jgi:hypothetical protein
MGPRPVGDACRQVESRGKDSGATAKSLTRDLPILATSKGSRLVNVLQLAQQFYHRKADEVVESWIGVVELIIVVGPYHTTTCAEHWLRSVCLFAVFCLLSLAWTFFFVPETVGRTLEQMDWVFKDHSNEAENDGRRAIESGILGARGRSERQNYRLQFTVDQSFARRATSLPSSPT